MGFKKDDHVLIVGAGVFGLSTALHLLQGGWENVTIYDRSSVLPAPDAASTDMNKVVRSSYSDPTYTRLTKEAIVAWKNTEEWGDTYHECGVVIRGGRDSYAELALQNDVDHGMRVQRLSSSADLSLLLPPDITFGPTLSSGFEGYCNFEAGWANAKQGIELALAKVRQLGARIEPSKLVCGLTSDGLGVKLEDGTETRANVIVIASGSWTPSAFPALGVAERVLATGQSVATIKLSEEEAKAYANVPVILDYTTGFYVFPPTASNVIKLGIHSAGYTHTPSDKGVAVSTPRTHMSHQDGEAIPKEMVQSLRTALNDVYPGLGQRPFADTRMCWYADTPDSNWLIDFHPEYPSVLLATGGSGHAYKFLPILGRLVVDRLEGKLDEQLAKRFAFDRGFDMSHLADLTRTKALPKELDISQLCGPDDL
ncbi:FAD dependent oxidoreductase [Gautieria morchelliformis]|nr:FAD dependent oxidoreductase [Gautieria morchelliformis]